MKTDSQGVQWHFHTMTMSGIPPYEGPACSWCELELSAVALGNNIIAGRCTMLVHEHCWQERNDHLRYMENQGEEEESQAATRGAARP